tara:strand:- start:2104 stop:2811 length:708 start_codon:yes stop_codon:yes gene_type:complete
MKIFKYDKFDLDSIILDKIKTIDDKKYIDLKYKYKKDNKTIKEKIFFTTSGTSLSLASGLKFNLLREHYLELLINDVNFYNFILDIEEKIKTLLLKKSNKIFTNISNEIDYNLIDEYFKSNLKLNKIYNNPIIKLNFIKNTKNNNTLIYYNSSKKLVSEDLLEENKDVSLIIRLDKIVLTNYTYEIEFIVEQIKLVSKKINQPERIINEYKFENETENNEISNEDDNNKEIIENE